MSSLRLAAFLVCRTLFEMPVRARVNSYSTDVFRLLFDWSIARRCRSLAGVERANENLVKGAWAVVANDPNAVHS